MALGDAIISLKRKVREMTRITNSEFVHKKFLDHDCDANDPQDGCIGCIEEMVEQGDKLWDEYKESHA